MQVERPLPARCDAHLHRTATRVCSATADLEVSRIYRRDESSGHHAVGAPRSTHLHACYGTGSGIEADVGAGPPSSRRERRARVQREAPSSRTSDVVGAAIEEHLPTERIDVAVPSTRIHDSTPLRCVTLEDARRVRAVGPSIEGAATLAEAPRRLLRLMDALAERATVVQGADEHGVGGPGGRPHRGPSIDQISGAGLAHLRHGRLFSTATGDASDAEQPDDRRAHHRASDEGVGGTVQHEPTIATARAHRAERPLWTGRRRPLQSGRSRPSGCSIRPSPCWRSGCSGR